ncbi:MAG: hypothetical protein ABID64_02475 [Nitrospirota bacterium]
MDNENHCTYKGEECDQIPKISCVEGKTVWQHIVGLTCNDPKDPKYIETGRNLGSYLFLNSTPEEKAKLQAEEGLLSTILPCTQCRINLEIVLGMWEETEAL